MATPLDTFHLFPQLPPELRLRIWELSLPSSRLIPIHCGTDPSSSSSSAEPDPYSSSSYSPGCTSPAPIPGNLHACTESRIHALSTRYTHALSFARCPGRVLLDHDADVLYFPPREGYMAASAQFHTCLSLCHPDDLRRIRRVALHEDLFSCSLSSSPPSSPGGGGGGGGGDVAAWPPSYWSGLAVSLTVECLRRIAERMPAVDEVIFVCADPDHPDYDPHEGPARLVAQINTAMADLAASSDQPKWNPPKWTVVAEPR